MKPLKLTRAFCGVAVAGILAGCGGAQSSVPTAVLKAPQEASWMLPAAKKQSLLYVSNDGNSSVTVYTYADGGGLILVGTLTGFSIPAGMCTDNAGDIWIADLNTRRIYEYAHGGTRPIETIQQHSGFPYSCAVDPKSGSLAVTSQHPNGKYQAYSVVDVYPKGSKEGRPYSAPHGFKELYFAAYDDAGNLFADGTPCYADNCYYDRSGPPGLYELASGASEFKRLNLLGATLSEPAAINWVKPTLLLGDRNFKNQGTSGAYKVFVSGSKATVVATLPFAGTQKTYGFWRRADRVVVPDTIGDIVRIYNLSDGTLYNTLSTKISSPFAVVVSQ